MLGWGHSLELTECSLRGFKDQQGETSKVTQMNSHGDRSDNKKEEWLRWLWDGGAEGRVSELGEERGKGSEAE